LLQSNSLRDSLHPILDRMAHERGGFNIFRRFRFTHLEKSKCPEALKHFWSRHAPAHVSERYVKLMRDREYRLAWAEKIGLGFELPKSAASPTAIVGTEILDLMGSVDPAHSRVGVFLMNETILTALKKLAANTAGKFLSMIGTDADGRSTLFGKTVYSSPSMPAATATLKPVAYGNFSRFYLRSVRGSLVLKRFDERYAEYAQVGFEMYWRAVGALAKSTNTPTPVKVLAMHA